MSLLPSGKASADKGLRHLFNATAKASCCWTLLVAIYIAPNVAVITTMTRAANRRPSLIVAVPEAA
jgi:hypothetical protein